MDHRMRDVAAGIRHHGVDAAAIFVVAHRAKPDLAAFDAAGELVARGFGAAALGIAAGAQLRRIDAFDADADGDFLVQPDRGGGLEGVAVDHADHARVHGSDE